MPEPQDPEADPPPPAMMMKSFPLLRRGLYLSKKAAIAGAAITSAPVVIPPMLLALAFSFPFAVYLAGFAFTNQVMAALLSPPLDDDEEQVEKGDDGSEIQTLGWKVDDEVVTTPFSLPNDFEDDGKSTQEKSYHSEVEPNENEGAVDTLEAVGWRGKEEDASITTPPYPTDAESGTDLVGEATDLVHPDDEGLRQLVEGAAATEQWERAEEGQVEVERDESDVVPEAHEVERWPPTDALEGQREDVHEIEMWPPTDALEIQREDVHVIEKWPPTDALEFQREDVHEIEMWPPTDALDALEVQRVDNMEGVWIENQIFVEEAKENNLENISSEQETDIMPTIASSINDENILGHIDDKGLRGSVGEGAATEQWERDGKGQVEVEGNGSDVVTAEQEMELWPPTDALEVQRKEGDSTEEMGIENQKFMEESRESKVENISLEQEININPTIASSIDEKDVTGDTNDKDCRRSVEEGIPMEQRASAEKVEVEGDESDVVTTEHEIEMWPPTTAVEVQREEEDHSERMGIQDQRCVEEVRGRKLDNNDREQETMIKPKTASSVDNEEDIIVDTGMLEESPAQVKIGAEEIDNKEEMGKRRAKVEIEKEKLNEEEFESSEFESLSNGVSESVEKNPTKEIEVDDRKEANEETLIVKEQREVGEGNTDAEIGQPTKSFEMVPVVHSDNEGLRGSVEESVLKQQSPRATKEQEGVDRDVSDLVTAEHKNEIWPTITTLEINGDEGDNAEEMGMGDQRFVTQVRESKVDNSDREQDTKIKPNIAYSVDSKEDVIRNTRMLEDGSDDKEEMGKSGERVEIEKEKLNEQEVSESSECSSPIDVNMVEKIKIQQEAEVILDAGVMHDTEKKGNETVVKEVMLEGRPEEDTEKVQGEVLSAIEANEPSPCLYHSLVSTPEKSEIELEHIALSSKYESSANGSSSGAVGERPTKERWEGESKVANEEKVTEKGSLAPVQNVIMEARGKAEETEIFQVNARVGGFDVESLEHESEMMPSSLSTEYASAVEDQSSEMTDVDSGPAVIVVGTLGVVHSDNEVLYSEEMKIWEEIHAMRTIVGYKDAVHSSLVDELKALYLFTGVEPPTSLGNTTDLMEVDNKLQFLKSVIGVE